ncbi:MAG TPA: 3-carboxy-cis,cis-muconate cycloisomerase [Devosia sp.]|nr:3-carboxy-cis,cis-muconate cycloisomerase [Devosia sp.]
MSNDLLTLLLGDAETAAQLSPDAELTAILLFESALAIAEAAEGVIPAEAAAAITLKLANLTLDQDALRDGAAKDGVIIPALVAQLRAEVGEPFANFVHFGATSQDAVDTSLIIRLSAILTLFEQRLHAITERHLALAAAYGPKPLMARTRMQEALPITVADRIAAWQSPLDRALTRLDELRPRLLVLQLGGPVGTLGELGDKRDAVTRRLAEALGLGHRAQSWHTQRDAIAELGNWLSLVTGALGKIGQDVALMAQNPIGEIALAGAGGSSAMPHKQNPVKAEVLVALARYNAALLGGLHQSLVHEQERSGAAWTLEWLVLPQMLLCTGASLRTAIELQNSITALGKANG